MRFGARVIFVATAGVFLTVDFLAKLMFLQQPMKMASAEALCRTETDPAFSILTISTLNNCETAVRVIDVPYVVPRLALRGQVRYRDTADAAGRAPARAAARPKTLTHRDRGGARRGVMCREYGDRAAVADAR